MATYTLSTGQPSRTYYGTYVPGSPYTHPDYHDTAHNNMHIMWKESLAGWAWVWNCPSNSQFNPLPQSQIGYTMCFRVGLVIFIVPWTRPYANINVLINKSREANSNAAISRNNVASTEVSGPLNSFSSNWGQGRGFRPQSEKCLWHWPDPFFESPAMVQPLFSESLTRHSARENLGTRRLLSTIVTACLLSFQITKSFESEALWLSQFGMGRDKKYMHIIWKKCPAKWVWVWNWLSTSHFNPLPQSRIGYTMCFHHQQIHAPSVCRYLVEQGKQRQLNLPVQVATNIPHCLRIVWVIMLSWVVLWDLWVDICDVSEVLAWQHPSGQILTKFYYLLSNVAKKCIAWPAANLHDCKIWAFA